jgi:hypothetical protein
MAPQRKPGRTMRRARARAHEQLVRDIERLAQLEPGGSPGRPLPVASPAVVDVVAAAKPCPLCGGALRLDAHEAEKVDGVRLRVARVTCATCGTRRAFYFSLSQPSLH